MNNLCDKIKKLIDEGEQVLATKFQKNIAPTPAPDIWSIAQRRYEEPITVDYVDDNLFNKWFKKVQIILQDSSYTSSIIEPHRFETNYDVTSRQLANLKAIQEILVDCEPNTESEHKWEFLTDSTISLYNNGHYPQAVLEAFVYIEDQVRKNSKLNELYGTDLMRKAFASKKGEQVGILTNAELPVSEQQAQSDLFSGAIGFIKNPKSHNLVSVHKEKATELLYFANYLLRIINGDYSQRL